MTTLYHNPRCSKSRQTLQVLKDANEEVTIVEYLKEVPTIDELKKILKMLDIPARKLVRTNEVVWKENYKGKDLTEEQLIEAMINNPKLIERPIAIKNGKAVIGRPPENVLNL
ncbi:arsenate reductase (glutaredoxin) [Patiriisocius marinus]|uniref:arsenate reductase (glutaredoxin) n=1 Tax=Patiriisocius marinus TaxID=1397112 RepID=UPI00232C37B7|nr:arsenate reductase (glutaredoxin) [Patiriisocius marinus]